MPSHHVLSLPKLHPLFIYIFGSQVVQKAPLLLAFEFWMLEARSKKATWFIQ